MTEIDPYDEAQKLQIDLDAAGLPWRVYPSGLMGQVSYRAERIGTAKHEVFAHTTSTLRKLVEDAEQRINPKTVPVKSGQMSA